MISQRRRKRSNHLEKIYQDRRATPHSINEHMDTLRHYASKCSVVTEFGVDVGFSTIAFLAAQPKELHSYDINRQPDIDLIDSIAATETRTRFEFHHQSSLDARFELTDLLFIDSLHDYAQVKQELELHGHKAQSYLVFHDTIAWAYSDERPSSYPSEANYSFGKHLKGIGPAIGEYMATHPEWKIIEHLYHQSGLTIYRRVFRSSDTGARRHRLGSL